MHLIFSLHAIRRMFKRGITVDDVRAVIENGKTIEEYSDDTPYSSRLVLGWSANRPIHVVVADNMEEKETIVVTVYKPDSLIWLPGFERRRKP